MSELAVREELDQHKEFSMVPPESDVLNLRAEEIPVEQITSPEIQAIIDGMYSVAEGTKDEESGGIMIGLAAPQIGISKRIVLFAVNNFTTREEPPVLTAFINPEIVEMSDEQEEDRESCYSTGDICGVVLRPKWVKMRAYDRNGQLVELVLEGYRARLAQHEIDHLDGLRFPDHPGLLNLHKVSTEKRKDYFDGEWATWPEAPDKEWIAVKTGVPLSTFA